MGRLSLLSSNVRRFPLYLLPLLLLAGCGGGGANNNQGPPPPPPSFTLSLTPSSISLAQSATQNVKVQSMPQNGFTGSIAVTASGLPSGVTVSPSNLVLNAGDTGTVAFSASASAVSGDARFQSKRSPVLSKLQQC